MRVFEKIFFFRKTKNTRSYVDIQINNEYCKDKKKTMRFEESYERMDEVCTVLYLFLQKKKKKKNEIQTLAD